jgi:hypothetical protein
MNKKIIIGCILILTLLLLMPSIPAIQMKTIEDRTYNDLVEQFNLKDFMDIKGLERLKHPFLFLIVYAMLIFRLYRGMFIYDLSMDWDGRVPIVKYPLLNLRSFFLWETVYWGIYGWSLISENRGWNWHFSFFE